MTARILFRQSPTQRLILLLASPVQLVTRRFHGLEGTLAKRPEKGADLFFAEQTVVVFMDTNPQPDVSAVVFDSKRSMISADARRP